ncbi:MAG: carboxypeptidase-like regulatory domain-containing protein [Bryobacteraceae bacterium]
MKTLLAALLSAAVMSAAIDGTVTNKTSGKVQPGATVTLIKLGGGMETVATAKSDSQGKFTMAPDLQAGTPYLVQTLYQGVTYNKAIPPGSSATGLTVDVYDSSPQGGDAKVAQHMVLFEPSGTDVTVNETIIYSNTGKTTFDDPANGTFRFYLPPETKGLVKVQVTGPQGMPIVRDAVKTKEPDIYTVKYPVKPGETRFDLAYGMPEASPGTFELKFKHDGSTVRVVAPKGVTLTSDNLKDLGPEPRTQATIYQVLGRDVKFQFTGTGSLRAAAEAAQQSEDTGPPIEDLKPRIYGRLYPLVGLAGFILVLGLIMLYRSEPDAKKRA